MANGVIPIRDDYFSDPVDSLPGEHNHPVCPPDPFDWGDFEDLRDAVLEVRNLVYATLATIVLGIVLFGVIAIVEVATR